MTTRKKLLLTSVLMLAVSSLGISGALIAQSARIWRSSGIPPRA